VTSGRKPPTVHEFSEGFSMMTADELHAARINAAVADAALEQSMRRLDDVLAIKASFENKALALFGGYISVALALFGAAGYSQEKGMTSLFAALAMSGVVFVIGGTFLLVALKVDDYGVTGSDPAMWLVPGVIDGGDRAVRDMKAYLAYYHANRIAISVESNDRKAEFLRYAVWAGLAAPIVLVIAIGVAAALR
jgi:hypothetical protein